MLPFLSILAAVGAFVAMAMTVNPEKLYRFTSITYDGDKQAIFEVRSTSAESAREAARYTLAIYSDRTNVKLKWELIEELDPKTNKVLTILYKLPEPTKESTR
jgi:hypothetical protein